MESLKKANVQKSEKLSLAIGKGKGESDLPESWLQDVFSDSANAPGSIRKTSRLFENEQGKEAQLKDEKDQISKRMSSGGRKSLNQTQKRTIKLQTHVTASEYNMIHEQLQAIGIRYLSDYLGLLILHYSKANIITKKKELIKQLDKMGAQVAKMVNDINQIAKYTNIQRKSGKVDRNSLINFNQQISIPFCVGRIGESLSCPGEKQMSNQICRSTHEKR